MATGIIESFALCFQVLVGSRNPGYFRMATNEFLLSLKTFVLWTTEQLLLSLSFKAVQKIYLFIGARPFIFKAFADVFQPLNHYAR
jgi:hypothetical protein